MSHPPVGDVDAAAAIAALRREVARLGAELAQVRAERDAFEVACHEDPTTGLLNRRGFSRELARAVAYVRRYGAPAALLLLDLDRFKLINDEHGHTVGDAALLHVATTLKANLRASDSIGRVGGDEFAILLWQVDLPTAIRKAEALEAILSDVTFQAGSGPLVVAGSIGAAALVEADDPATVSARADRAMYERKLARRVVPATR